MTGFAVEDGNEEFPPADNDAYNPDEIHCDNVNIIIGMKVILNEQASLWSKAGINIKNCIQMFCLF